MNKIEHLEDRIRGVEEKLKAINAVLDDLFSELPWLGEPIPSDGCSAQAEEVAGIGLLN
jgi:hypothetical protein